MAARHSELFHILALLRDGRWRSADDIFDHLRRTRDRLAQAGDDELILPRSTGELNEWLHSLRDIGVLRLREQRDGPPLWRRDGVGGGDGGGGGTGDAGGDGAGGAGLSEVLGHPVLLCLPLAAQDQVLDAAFGLNGEGRDAVNEEGGAA